jgi:hypothetical protein
MTMGGNLWWHMLIDLTTKQKLSITHTRGSASLLFEQFLLLGAIYMVAHLFWLPIISPKFFLMELD